MFNDPLILQYSTSLDDTDRIKGLTVIKMHSIPFMIQKGHNHCIDNINQLMYSSYRAKFPDYQPKY